MPIPMPCSAAVSRSGAPDTIMASKSAAYREISRQLKGTAEQRNNALARLEKLHTGLCYHEAAHAVMQWQAAIQLGSMYTFTSIHVSSQQELLAWGELSEQERRRVPSGCVLLEPLTWWRSAEREHEFPGVMDRAIMLEAMVYLAGPLAELKFARSRGSATTLAAMLDGIAELPGPTDITKAKRYAKLLGGPEQFDRAIKYVSKLLERDYFWSFVTKTASALAERQTLTEDEFFKIVIASTAAIQKAPGGQP